VESLEKERDFYFGKLRDVEILLQSYSGPDRPTVDALFKILYMSDDEFVSAGGDGEGGLGEQNQ
jgi:RP/EB family microtubule-associated protein